MGDVVTIGDFSRMTHLSVKTLRYYHQVALLVPVEIDADSGYRYYDIAQVPTAQVIRRFRDLDMPVDEVREVLAAPDVATRNQLISLHLERIERQLDQTQSAVTSLRNLLEGSEVPLTVEHRSMNQIPVLAIGESVSRDELGSWWSAAFGELRQAIRNNDCVVVGPPGGLYETDLFLHERGDALVYLPIQSEVNPAVPSGGRLQVMNLPESELAIMTHVGPHEDIDLTYGALGSYVTTHALGIEGPVHERYLICEFDTSDASQWRTEIGWPIFQTVP
jgi:DNA-binding transcriptional MerR regulator